MQASLLIRHSSIRYHTGDASLLLTHRFSAYSADEWKTLVEESKEPVVVDFFATWCGPCKAVSPLVEKLSDSVTSVKFYKVDVDELSTVAADNGISAMPTFLFYKNGEKQDKLTVRGANPPAIQQAVAEISA
jgi:thioredoxin 1